MATEYIHELGDSMSAGASSDGPHVKVIAPEKYKVPGSDTYKTIDVEIVALGEQLETLAADIAYKDAYDGKWIGLGNPVNASMNTDELKYWRLCSFTISSWWSLQFEMDVTNGLYDWNTYETKIVKIGGYSSGTSVDFAQEIREYHGAVNTDRGYGNILYYTLSGTTVTVYVRSKRVANASQFCRLNKVVDKWNITSLTWYSETTAPTQPSSPTKLTEVIGKQPERLVVTLTESGGVYSNDFSTISAAVTAGKDVWLRISSPYDNSTYFHYVPLSEAVFKNGAYIRFIFARPRSYETDAEGIIDTWTCTETSPYWTYSDNNVYYATTSGTAATAGTANSASNANLGKTTDTTNGDVLYIGGGTQQRIENAGHANSAKDYDQTGSIATALNSKQNLLYFTNTDGGTTSNPAADKKYVDSSIASWMLAVGTSYVKYRCNGEGIGSGNIGSIFWLSQIIYLAQDTVRIDIRGDFSSITKDNRFAIFPAYAYCGLNGSAEIRYKCKQYVRYIITLTNVGDSSATIWAISGGRATQSQAGYIRRGTLQIDGAIFETDTVSQPQNWDIGYFNFGAIGSIPAKSSRTWEMFWFGTEDTPGTAFSGRDYTYITTIK